MPLPSRQHAAILGGLTIAAVAVAGYLFWMPSSGWSTADRTSFIESCNRNCRSAPGVTPDRYPLCDKACTCAADEGEKIASGRELAEIEEAHKAGTASSEQNEKMQRITKAGLACIAGALRQMK